MAKVKPSKAVTKPAKGAAASTAAAAADIDDIFASGPSKPAKASAKATDGGKKKKSKSGAGDKEKLAADAAKAEKKKLKESEAKSKNKSGKGNKAKAAAAAAQESESEGSDWDVEDLDDINESELESDDDNANGSAAPKVLEVVDPSAAIASAVAATKRAEAAAEKERGKKKSGKGGNDRKEVEDDKAFRDSRGDTDRECGHEWTWVVAWVLQQIVHVWWGYPSELPRLLPNVSTMLTRPLGKRTEEGFLVFKEAELSIDPTAGGTPLCPFDCDCCEPAAMWKSHEADHYHRLLNPPRRALFSLLYKQSLAYARPCCRGSGFLLLYCCYYYRPYRSVGPNSCAYYVTVSVQSARVIHAWLVGSSTHKSNRPPEAGIRQPARPQDQ